MENQTENEKLQVLIPTQGYKVLGVDNEFQKFSGVLQTHDQIVVELYFANSTHIRCTLDHKIKTKTGWKTAQELKCGDYVLDKNGSELCIVYKSKSETPETVYDLVNVENGNQYIGNGIVNSNCILLDEFAYIPNNIAEDFFSSTYPTISSGQNTKLILVSTPKGLNHFYKMWTEAINGINNYKWMDIKWNDVPGRDEKWKAETIKALPGKERQFRVEFDCEFQGSQGSLIDPTKLAKIPFTRPVREFTDGYNLGLVYYELPQPDRKYITLCDVARGVEGDASAFLVVDMTDMPYKVVARYKNNVVPTMVYPNIIANTSKYYNSAYVLVEIRDIGLQIAQILYYELEYENLLTVTNRKRGQELFSGFGEGGTTNLGLMTTTGVKNSGCQSIKSLIEDDKFIINDYELLNEFSTFASKKHSFEAEEGCHDDLVMCAVFFGWVTTQTNFMSDIANINFRKKLFGEQLDVIDKEFGPMDIMISDGVDTYGLHDDEEEKRYGFF